MPKTAPKTPPTIYVTMTKTTAKEPEPKPADAKVIYHLDTFGIITEFIVTRESPKTVDATRTDGIWDGFLQRSGIRQLPKECLGKTHWFADERSALLAAEPSLSNTIKQAETAKALLKRIAKLKK